MNVVPVNNVNIHPSAGGQPLTSKTKTSFSKVLNNALDKVNQSLTKSDQSMTEIASGNVQNLHNAMIDIQKSNILLQATVEVRNKVIDAYQEMMRMQI
ncbi:flagellar hook-basal body complex protein FliE [Scopulibacillus cellulosilyticus]|uniref:Flagellar hook-basal body complex protein FliE n=1 Tax=Scopulibacillus cellulosilyticus TaxID=2665665 RepID=A0ABW2PT01_9BACL